MKIDALLLLPHMQSDGNKNESELNSWQWDGFLTYIQLSDKSDAPKLKPASCICEKEGRRKT